ncbi:hypothetical protein GOV10_03665 [Candidatus Woesearchaeota archaeon]|nr:hypothetical protein [Candidatus Woesearchaeota archaeon]
MSSVLFACVEDFLRSQLRGRPQTFEEIVLCVDKARSSCWREVNTLLLFGVVRIILLRFNGRECPFYTMRKDVEVSVVKGPVLVEVSSAKTLIIVDELDKEKE